MKKLNLIQFLFLCLILFSCHSKPEIKQQPRVEYTIQNYKLDDDEIEKRKLADSLAKETTPKEEKIDSSFAKK